MKKKKKKKKIKEKKSRDLTNAHLRGTKCSQKQTHILGNIYSMCKANYKYSQLYPVNDWTTGSSIEMEAFKKWKKIKRKKEKENMSQNSKIAGEVSSKSSKRLNTKQNSTVRKQTKKHRPKYIFCLIKLCKTGNVLKPEFDQYT